MIAVPTNNLKSELVQKIGRDKVLEIPSFEDLPLPPELRQTIEKNYSMGFINDALESIKTYAHNSKDNSIFMNYLHPETALAHSSKYVIMTHARFLTLPNRVLKNFEVLIDEDGKEVEFEVCLTLEAEGKEYAILLPLDEESYGDDEDVALVFRIDSDENGDILVPLEDEEEYQIVVDVYNTLMDEEGLNDNEF